MRGPSTLCLSIAGFLKDLKADLRCDALQLPLSGLVHSVYLFCVVGMALDIRIILHDLVEEADPGTKLASLE